MTQRPAGLHRLAVLGTIAVAIASACTTPAATQPPASGAMMEHSAAPSGAMMEHSPEPSGAMMEHSPAPS